MTNGDWIALAGVALPVIGGIIGALISHMVSDARNFVTLAEVKRRLDLLDGNGLGSLKVTVATLDREVNQNVRPALHKLANQMHTVIAEIEMKRK